MLPGPSVLRHASAHLTLSKSLCDGLPGPPSFRPSAGRSARLAKVPLDSGCGGGGPSTVPRGSSLASASPPAETTAPCSVEALGVSLAADCTLVTARGLRQAVATEPGRSAAAPDSSLCRKAARRRRRDWSSSTWATMRLHRTPSPARGAFVLVGGPTTGLAAAALLVLFFSGTTNAIRRRMPVTTEMSANGEVGAKMEKRSECRNETLQHDTTAPGESRGLKHADQ
eukprot:scaffold30926_cov62-Phaeocystis_antarctica.AAC.4